MRGHDAIRSEPTMVRRPLRWVGAAAGLAAVLLACARSGSRSLPRDICSTALPEGTVTVAGTPATALPARRSSW